MKIKVITLFPGMLKAITDYGITRKAVDEGLISIDAVNPRDFTRDKHQTVDDRPFGGGPGMVMKVEPLLCAIGEAKAQLGQKDTKVIYLSPQGKRLDQPAVQRLAKEPALLLVAGRYEGIDERVIDLEVDEQWSIGDFVLSGGELPAMVMIDAIARCLPGVLGHEESAQQDSFSGDLKHLLDCPHYTRPEHFEGETVPAVLLSGHHGEIQRWRLKQSLGRTWLLRPDLLARRMQGPGLTEEEERLLEEFQQEHQNQQLK